MSGDKLAEARARRDAAWASLNGRITALRTGLAERPIQKRIKDAAMDRVIDMVDEAKAVAKDNIPVIGATLALLAGWFFRRPLMALIKSRFTGSDDADEDVT